MKNKVQDVQQDALKDLWVNIELDFFVKLADPMPTRPQMVLTTKGNMTNYSLFKKYCNK